MPILIRDAETRSELDLEEVGAWRYSTHPSTDVLLYSYCVDDGPIQTWRRGDPPPQEFIQAATEPEWLVAAFNESFERGLELNVLIPHYCFPRIPDARRRCLQMSALAQALPAKLERVAAALGLPVQKDKAGRKAMLEMARPRAPLPGEDPSGIYWHEDEERWARNTAYNVRDVEVEREVYRHLGFVSLSELELAALDTIINDRGVGIDRVLLDAALKIAEAAVPAQIAEFDALTEGAFEKPRTPKLRAWLEERGIKVPNLQAETLQKVLARPGLSPELRRVLEVRIDLAQSATAGKLVAMRNWCGADGRVRWAFRHHGASTGRATSLGIQLQNMKKPGDTDLTAAIAAISTGDYETVRKQFGDAPAIPRTSPTTSSERSISGSRPRPHASRARLETSPSATPAAGRHGLGSHPQKPKRRSPKLRLRRARTPGARRIPRSCGSGARSTERPSMRCAGRDTRCGPAASPSSTAGSSAAA